MSFKRGKPVLNQSLLVPAEQNDLHMTGIVGIMCMQSLVLIYRQTSAMINDLSTSVFGKRIYAERERLSPIANDRKRILEVI